MKGFIKSFNISTLFAVIFALLGTIFLIFAMDGIAIALSFFTKLLFFLSFICFAIAIVFYILKKKVKIKITEK